MFGFIKFIIGLTAVAGVAYVVFFVDFGDKTLYQHGVRISNTEEAKDLEKGLKSEAKELSKKVTIEIAPDAKPDVNDEKNTASSASGGKAASTEDNNPIAGLIRSKLSASEIETKPSESVSATLTAEDKIQLKQLLLSKKQ